MDRVSRGICGLMVLVFSSVVAAAGVTKTVEQLYLEKAELGGAQVEVRGTVVKVNNNIMNRNFIHLQDGSGSEGSNRITVTSQQTANVGAVVTVNGTLVVDRDFGAGYIYPLLIEEATLTGGARGGAVRIRY